jgi:hypothetical protein
MTEPHTIELVVETGLVAVAVLVVALVEHVRLDVGLPRWMLLTMVFSITWDMEVPQKG